MHDRALQSGGFSISDPAKALELLGPHFDRIGDPSGTYLAVMLDGVPASFESRAMPADGLKGQYAKFDLLPGAIERMREMEVHFEVSIVAPGFARKGGALQAIMTWVNPESGMREPLSLVDALLKRVLKPASG